MSSEHFIYGLRIDIYLSVAKVSEGQGSVSDDFVYLMIEVNEKNCWKNVDNQDNLDHVDAGVCGRDSRKT